MKIEHIEVHHLRYEYPEGEGFRYSGGLCTARVTTIILVRTDTAHVGIGSCYTHPGMAELTIANLTPLLKGHDPRQVEKLWDLMYGATRWYGRKGAAISALGALDVAFWDLKGQAEETPVYKLLGGNKNLCPAYASALLWQDAPSAAREAAKLKARGWKRMKMRMGQGEAKDLANLRAIREAVGYDVDLMCDAGMRLDIPTAKRIGKILEKEKVFWFEEPFLPEDLESYRALHGQLSTLVAGGENEFGVQGFRDLIEPQCVDIVQPDVSRCGGISETHKIATLAGAKNIGVATHTWSDAIAVVANAHVVAACATGITVEVDQTGNPFIEELLASPLPVADGLLDLGDAPGLGIELNFATLEKYRLADAFHVPDGRYSDMVFGNEHFTPAAAYEKNQ